MLIAIVVILILIIGVLMFTDEIADFIIKITDKKSK